jgi:hypothetical protein
MICHTYRVQGLVPLLRDYQHGNPKIDALLDNTKASVNYRNRGSRQNLGMREKGNHLHVAGPGRWYQTTRERSGVNNELKLR